ncbi:methyltransferase domain-containing protein [Massilia sp. GCM10023247]|uniref:methyltransferase domain-containing protein n=1 Tax=Massilia sp. GCM10023247 TaxID=3252643 RepID=UPI0036176196
MLNEREIESCYLGQFIPVHYHHNMLMDHHRMDAFQAAIKHAVRPGMKVLELGGGTGVLSYFAAQQAERVYCVEFNPDLVREARRFLAMNPNGHKVEVIHADAFDYLPPEPVDIVICEMIHVAMLREKQVAVIEAFKARYLAKFGGPLPVFMPEAVVMAVQPLQQSYEFNGYYAPIVQFQDTGVAYPGTMELAVPAVYSMLDFAGPVDSLIAWRGNFTIEQDGCLNALRFVTKNILSIDEARATTIDWLNHYMCLPLARPLDVVAGDVVEVAFTYRAGASIPSLQASIRAGFAHEEALGQPAVERSVEFA